MGIPKASHLSGGQLDVTPLHVGGLGLPVKHGAEAQGGVVRDAPKIPDTQLRRADFRARFA